MNRRFTQNELLDYL